MKSKLELKKIQQTKSLIRINEIPLNKTFTIQSLNDLPENKTPKSRKQYIQSLNQNPLKIRKGTRKSQNLILFENSKSRTNRKKYIPKYTKSEIMNKLNIITKNRESK